MHTVQKVAHPVFTSANGVHQRVDHWKLAAQAAHLTADALEHAALLPQAAAHRLQAQTQAQAQQAPLRQKAAHAKQQLEGPCSPRQPAVLPVYELQAATATGRHSCLTCKRPSAPSSLSCSHLCRAHDLIQSGIGGSQHATFPQQQPRIACSLVQRRVLAPACATQQVEPVAGSAHNALKAAELLWAEPRRRHG